MNCEMLIRNGMILDGTGSASIGGDVGIRDGHIRVLGDLSRNAKAVHVIDAEQLAAGQVIRRE